MEFKKVRKLLWPLIIHGQRWQHLDINGAGARPKLYFSWLQFLLIALSIASLFFLQTGISTNVIGHIMTAFGISVSLFMSLLISIFDKFEKTPFELPERTAEALARLKQKKNFFKRFISITSYLVVLSILVIVLCAATYLSEKFNKPITTATFAHDLSKIDWEFTAKCSALLFYRGILNYFLLDYLLLTCFITGSAFEYYMSELNARKIPSL